MRFVAFILLCGVFVVDGLSQVTSAISSPFELKVGYTGGVKSVYAISPSVILEVGNKKTRDVTVVSAPMLLDVGYSDIVVANGVSNSITLQIRDKEPELPAHVRTPAIISESDQEEVEDASAINYALIIGVSEYENSGADLSDLSQPVNDAMQLKDILIAKYTFESEHVTLLKNAERNDILIELEKLARKITEKDNLLIFYAGHGEWDGNLGVGYWLPSDAHPTFKSNWISNSTIRDYIAGIKSKHTLLISDACFAGSIFKTRGGSEQLGEFGLVRVNMLPSRKAMTSGTLSVVPDDSKFMEYLLKRLSDLELDHFTSHQLFSSVEVAVMNNTNNLPQYGVIKDTGDEGGDFVFRRRVAANK